jgi:NADPH:quinone reductase-like Zn-dependent oxidoreductase
LRGKRVAVLNGIGGNWAEQVVVPSRQVVPLPPSERSTGRDLFVNPASAIVMTRYVFKVPRRSVALTNGSGQPLGRMVIRLGAARGRTINLYAVEHRWKS